MRQRRTGNERYRAWCRTVLLCLGLFLALPTWAQTIQAEQLISAARQQIGQVFQAKRGKAAPGLVEQPDDHALVSG